MSQQPPSHEPTASLTAIAGRVHEARERIAQACARAGRPSGGVRLIAVTKEQAPQVLAPLLACGVTDCGENRIEHAQEMIAAAPAGLAFHVIGRVQGRQLARIAAMPAITHLHSLADVDHVERLARALEAVGRRLQVFIQVNTANDPAKSGCSAVELPAFVERVRLQPRLDLVGLMTMAEHPQGVVDADDRARRAFAGLRELARVQGLQRLRMGMSGDFVVAIEEGATDVRIGTALFADHARSTG